MVSHHKDEDSIPGKGEPEDVHGGTPPAWPDLYHFGVNLYNFQVTPEKEPVCVCSLQSIAFNYYLMNFWPFIQKVEHMFGGMVCVCLKTKKVSALYNYFIIKNKINNG